MLYMKPMFRGKPFHEVGSAKQNVREPSCRLVRVKYSDHQGLQSEDRRQLQTRRS